MTKKLINAMDIGKVAQQTGLTASTLRYYEKVGLIKSNGRNGLRRTFPNSVIKQLKLIILLKNNLFSLEEIQQMTARNSVDRQFLSEKVEEIKHKINELATICNTLEHIINCPKDNHFDCQSFQQLLNEKR